MVSAIFPIVHGKQQRCSCTVTVVLHCLGLLLGAAAFGLVLGLISSLLPHYWRESSLLRISVLGIGAVIFGMHELQLIRLPEMWLYRQVPRDWAIVYHPYTAALLYGMGLGPGLGTLIPVSTFYVLISWIALTGGYVSSIALMMFFALGRAIPFIIAAFYVHSSDDAKQFVRMLLNFSRPMHLVNGSLLILSGISVIAFRL